MNDYQWPTSISVTSPMHRIYHEGIVSLLSCHSFVCPEVRCRGVYSIISCCKVRRERCFHTCWATLATTLDCPRYPKVISEMFTSVGMLSMVTLMITISLSWSLAGVHLFSAVGLLSSFFSLKVHYPYVFICFICSSSSKFNICNFPSKNIKGLQFPLARCCSCFLFLCISVCLLPIFDTEPVNTKTTAFYSCQLLCSHSILRSFQCLVFILTQHMGNRDQVWKEKQILKFLMYVIKVLGLFKWEQLRLINLHSPWLPIAGSWFWRTT